MSRYFSIKKIPFAAAVFGLTAFLLTGFLTFRPNRIAPGNPVFIWETQGGLWVVVMVLWAILITISTIRMPGRWQIFLNGILSYALVPLLITAASQHASITTGIAGPVARTSLGPAFWVSLASLVIILMETWQKSEQYKSFITAIAVITGLSIFWMLFSGKLDTLSIMREFANRKERFFDEVLTHLLLVGSSVGLALVIGIPLGLLAHRKKQLDTPTFFTLNTLQTMPSLALFGILIPILASLTVKFPILAEMGIRGIGTAPAIIALTVYSLLPVARNTYTGFATVDPSAVEAGTGMGMTSFQLLFRVEIPIASPVILNGIRIALVQAIGLTAVAALIGAGGLGVFIFQGLGQAANDLILLGAIPTIFIAVVVDSTMNGMIRVLQPKGLR